MEKATIKRKIEAVDILKEKLETAKTVVSFDYAGLTVEAFTKLRRELRQAGSELKVYKNNIARRAAGLAGFDQLVDNFVGAKAIAISYDDVVAPAKIVNDFAKVNKQVEIKDGLIEGVYASADQLKALASIPSREVLLTQLAVGLLMPVRELTIGLHMISEGEAQQA